MAFFDAITSIINPKNILTAGGALAGSAIPGLGTAVGAGLGRGVGEATFGDDFVPFNYGDDPTNLANVVGEGAMGAGTTLAGQSALSAIRGAPETAAAGAGTSAAAGGGASGTAPGMDFTLDPHGALAGGAGSSAEAAMGSGTFDQPVVARTSESVAVPEAGGAAGGAGGAGAGMIPFQRQMMGLAGAQALGRMGSGLMEGSMEERRRKRLERLGKLLQPKLKQTLQGLDF